MLQTDRRHTHSLRTYVLRAVKIKHWPTLGLHLQCANGVSTLLTVYTSFSLAYIVSLLHGGCWLLDFSIRSACILSCWRLLTPHAYATVKTVNKPWQTFFAIIGFVWLLGVFKVPIIVVFSRRTSGRALCYNVASVCCLHCLSSVTYVPWLIGAS